MEYNIDILVAGCNTSCLHCYVNGGPAPQMRLEDFCLCMDRLAPVFRRFGNALSFTLDNELYNHDCAQEILRCVRERNGSAYYHHGSTSGIALANRADARELLRFLRQSGWGIVSFTLHGGEAAHNRIVANPSALAAMKRAAALCSEEGLEIWISLMASKQLLADRAEVAALLASLPHDHLLPVIPDYYPTPRLRRYQAIRCNKGEAAAFADFMAALGVPEAQMNGCRDFVCESQVYAAAEAGRLRLHPKEKLTAFFHIDQRLDFYRGNTGAALERCGNIARLSPEEICDIIAATGDNYYETPEIHYRDLRVGPGSLRRSSEDYAYPNAISCAIAMLDNARQDGPGRAVGCGSGEHQ